MIDMPGDFAVVIHGEFDCLNCFHHHVGRSAAKFYSTRLTEQQIITGETQEPLRRLLQMLAEQRAPDAVIVLGTCPVEVIGDRFEVVVDNVSEATGIPMIALHTSGLKLSSQRAMLDWMFSALAQLPPTPAKDHSWQRQAAEMALDLLFGDADTSTLQGQMKRLIDQPSGAGRVNLVGLPDTHGRMPEPLEILGRAGIEVNGVYPFGAGISDWRAISHADATWVVDEEMFPKFVGTLKGFGQDIIEMGLPVGLAPCVAFYRSVAERYGVSDQMDAVLEPMVHQLSDRMNALRAETRGMRMAVAIRMLNTYQSDQLAYEGLGDLPALQEMGFEVTLLVQGPPEESTRTAFAARLAELGYDLPFTVFPGPWILGDYLVEGGFDVACVPDSSRDEAHAAGVPMISARALAPFLEGVGNNVALVERLVREARRGV